MLVPFMSLMLPAVLGLDNFLSASQKQRIFDEGARQLMSMRNSSTIPRFGDCWTRALDRLETTCAALSDRSQAELALRFGKCFMEMASGEIVMASSVEHGDPDLWCSFGDHACMRRLPDRHFAAFTQFYSQTVQICYFVHGQRWHDQTQRQIEELRHQSQRVHAKMEVAGQLQATMMVQQKEQIGMQREAHEQSIALRDALGAGRQQVEQMAEEWRQASQEQRRLIGDVFGRIVDLHSWLASEGSWSGRWAWWLAVGSVGWMLMAAGGKRTQKAKLPVIMISIVGLWIDGQMWSLLVLALDEQRSLVWVWVLRRCFVAAMLGTCLMVALRYEDEKRDGIERLKRLEIQIQEMLNLLKTMFPVDGGPMFGRDSTPERASSVVPFGTPSIGGRSVSTTPHSVMDIRRSNRLQLRQKLHF